MNRERAIQFCHTHTDKEFYQPIVFVPGIIEIQGKWNEATKELAGIILEDCAGKSVLDLGCMHGYFLHEAKRRGAAEAVGVDHDTVEMGIAEEINAIFDDGVTLVHENLDKFSPDHPFDIVLMMNIIHVLDDPSFSIVRYLDSTKERLVVEYREDHDKFFPRSPEWAKDSPRSTGYRKLSYFLKTAEHDKATK